MKGYLQKMTHRVVGSPIYAIAWEPHPKGPQKESPNHHQT